ncbi:MAG: HEAT repeat protein [Planctomycetota bacterium]
MSTPLTPLLLALFASDPQPQGFSLDGASVMQVSAPSASVLEEHSGTEGSGEASSLRGSFEAVLLNPADSEDQLAKTINSLLGLGPGLLQHYVKVLGSRQLPDTTPLDEGRRRALLEAITLLDRASVISFVEQLATRPGNSLDDRRGALELLAQVGRQRELALALKLCADENSEVIDANLRQSLCESVQGLLQNDAGTHIEIRSIATSLDPTAASPLVRAVAEDQSADAWVTLERLLGASPELDRVTLTSIGQLARKAPGTSPALLTEQVAGYLSDSDLVLVRRAIATLGALDAQGQYLPLIALLDNEQEDVQEVAHLALVKLTDLELPSDSRRWRNWLKTEEDWWRLEASVLLKQVRCGQLGGTQAALRSLSSHRLRRDEIARAILPLLELESPELRSAACDALGILGAKIAVPAIEELRHYYGESDESSGPAAAALARLKS